VQFLVKIRGKIILSLDLLNLFGFRKLFDGPAIRGQGQAEAAAPSKSNLATAGSIR
jgi:hypothetical protein